MNANSPKVVSMTDAKREAPLVPQECCVRGDYMPLYGDRLFTSTFMANATALEFRAAMRLWWEAWQQTPAASLPSEDKILADLAGFGKDLRSWRRVKDMALHGFVLCSDGRWYHRMLAKEAVKLSERRAKDRNRKHPPKAPDGQDAEESAGKSQETCTEVTQDLQGNSTDLAGNLQDDSQQNQSFTPNHPKEVTPEGKGIDWNGREGSVPNGTGAPPEASLPLPTDARTLLFHRNGKGGLAIVRRLIGKAEGPSRTYIGKLLQACGDDAAAAHGILLAADDLRPADPASWIAAAAKARGNPAATKAAKDANASPMAKLRALREQESAATPSPADDRVIDGECEDVEL